MPPKKTCQQQEQSRMKAVETKSQKHAALGSETAAEDLWDQLQEALTNNKQLEQQLSWKSLECESLHVTIASIHVRFTSSFSLHLRSEQHAMKACCSIFTTPHA